MMLITILAAGSRGDTQPYLALGVALKKLGCRVRIAAFENYESFISAYGLEFSPIHGDVSRVAASESVSHARQADNPLKIFLSFSKLKNLVFDLQKDFFNACAGADAIVYHPGAAIGYFIAQHHKIPSILAAPFPMVPTRDYPSLIFYDSLRLGKSFNLATHKIFEQIMWSASSSAVKQFWKQEFGRLPDQFSSPFSKQTTRTHPTMISCSDYVFPRPADWSEHIHNTGYWFLDEDESWTPPAELLDFLQLGKPPVYVGFGSLSDAAAAEKTTRLVIQALRHAGQRGVLATGWNGMTRLDDAPKDIFILESAPHSWLFPRMAAVVHHGGAGTTAAGLRAGVPGIVIPHSNDQFAWGRRVYELGVGAKPVPRKKLTVERLAEAIEFALTAKIQAAARELGGRIQGENGAEKAAKIILDTLAPE
jgi:sterol 3beta-glucosyltransferase